MLDTPYNTTRAHKFYEKAGFKKVTEDELPIKLSHPYKDCDFFILNLYFNTDMIKTPISYTNRGLLIP